MGDQQNAWSVARQATETSLRVAAELFRPLFAPARLFSARGMQNLAVPEEDLMAIPRPEENIQRTFVAFISDETADKLRAMFIRNSCPDFAPLTKSPELPPECQLVICCLPYNQSKLYLKGETTFTKLITEAGAIQAMVLIIIFGEKETPEETLHDEKIYEHVLRQGRELYKKGRMHSQESQTSGGVSKSVALVTVDNRPSKYQLCFMKKFVEDAFTDKETIPKST